MATSYEEFTNISGEQYIIRTDSNGVVSFVPCDPANADYRAYLNRDNQDWGKPLL